MIHVAMATRIKSPKRIVNAVGNVNFRLPAAGSAVPATAPSVAVMLGHDPKPADCSSRAPPPASPLMGGEVQYSRAHNGRVTGGTAPPGHRWNRSAGGSARRDRFQRGTTMEDIG